MCAISIPVKVCIWSMLAVLPVVLVCCLLLVGEMFEFELVRYLCRYTGRCAKSIDSAHQETKTNPIALEPCGSMVSSSCGSLLFSFLLVSVVFVCFGRLVVGESPTSIHPVRVPRPDTSTRTSQTHKQKTDMHNRKTTRIKQSTSILVCTYIRAAGYT